MKKTLLFLMLLQGISILIHAQTHYGSAAGTLGVNHSYFGNYAGNASTNSSGYNSFFGAYCGRNTATGYSNTAAGSYALNSNTEGFYNTAVGFQALRYNTNNDFSVAVGSQALYSSNYTSGGCFPYCYFGPNTANGYRALYATTEGISNTATGSLALRYNATGTYNVATGFKALYNNTTADYNAATGAHAMEANTTGERNSAYGARALSLSGSENSAFGFQALYSEGPNSCTGANNTSFGAYAGFAQQGSCDLNNTTALGYLATVTASDQVRIGNSAVTSIGGQVSWSILSDGRFKKDLKNDVSGLDFINQLNPVSYTLDKDAFDKFLGIPDSLQIKHTETKKPLQYQIGFVAQEVEAVIKKSGYVFSGVETPQNERDPYTIRYAEFVVPLVKAVQELSVIADARQKEIVELKETLHNYMEDIPVGEKQSSDTAPFQKNAHSFSGSTEIHIELPDVTAQAHLIIYNLEGKEIKGIQVHERGNTTIKISGKDLSPGMYLYALIADGKVLATNELTMK